MRPEKRRPFIAGNWKMNSLPSLTAAFFDELKPLIAGAACDVGLCVPFVCLPAAVSAAAGSGIQVGAQNLHFEDKGAFTGEISAAQLCDLGVTHVIIGHSERRTYFGETDESIHKKVKQALKHGLFPIVCVGETLAQRELGITNELVSAQVKIALCDLTADEMARVTIAYEPVWAIGTGKTATAEQANEVCGIIRACVADLYGADMAEKTVIQYGGSMNPGNARELLSMEHVDGGLIGGASLKPDQFAAIIAAAKE